MQINLMLKVYCSNMDICIGPFLEVLCRFSAGTSSLMVGRSTARRGTDVIDSSHEYICFKNLGLFPDFDGICFSNPGNWLFLRQNEMFTNFLSEAGTTSFRPGALQGPASSWRGLHLAVVGHWEKSTLGRHWPGLRGQFLTSFCMFLLGLPNVKPPSVWFLTTSEFSEVPGYQMIWAVEHPLWSLWFLCNTCKLKKTKENCMNFYSAAQNGCSCSFVGCCWSHESWGNKALKLQIVAKAGLCRQS